MRFPLISNCSPKMKRSYLNKIFCLNEINAKLEKVCTAQIFNRKNNTTCSPKISTKYNPPKCKVVDLKYLDRHLYNY